MLRFLQNILEGRLLTLSKHPNGNFVVQKLLAGCTSKERFDAWYEAEFDDGLEDILSAGNTGVALAVAQTCRRLQTKQNHFLVVRNDAKHNKRKWPL